MNILLFISDKGSVEGDSRILAKLFHERLQLLVIEFIPYVTLFTRDMYRHSELFCRVGILWISLRFWLISIERWISKETILHFDKIFYFENTAVGKKWTVLLDFSDILRFLDLLEILLQILKCIYLTLIVWICTYSQQ